MSINIYEILKNVTRQNEYDPRALEIENAIKHSIQLYVTNSGHYQLGNSPPNSVYCVDIWKYYTGGFLDSTQQYEKEMLQRHGYLFDDNNYQIYFFKGAHCLSDKRMMSADEMFTFYENLLEEKRKKYEKYMNDTAYNTFNCPSLSTVDNGDYITKVYSFRHMNNLPYHLKIVEEIQLNIPGLRSETDKKKYTIILCIPKNSCTTS